MARRAIATSFNPEQFRAQALSLPQEDLADVALNWKQKFVNQVEETRKVTEQLFEFGTAGFAAWGLSALEGKFLYEKRQIEAQWLIAHPTPVGGEATSPFVDGDETDPTAYLLGVPNTLWITLALGVASVMKLGGKKYNYLVRSATIGALASLASSWGRDFGYSWGEDAASKA